MKKQYVSSIICMLLLFVLVFVPCSNFYADNAYSEGVGATAAAYIVYNATTGEIVTGKNVHELHYPASITKVMTALLLIEHCYNFDEVITFSHSAVTEISSDSSTLPPVAKEGERMTVRDVLFGMFLASGNECANMLGEYVAGNTTLFAQMMNERAAQIGAKDTHFMNAHGLHDDNHYTTPYDMALIFAEALKNPTFRELASTIRYTIPQTNMTPPRALEMGHRIVAQASGYICEGVFAGKTGRTPQAGRTLVTASERNGVQLITVVMKSAENHHYSDTIGLINYAYDLLDNRVTPVNFKECLEEVVVSGTTSGVNVRMFPTTSCDVMGRLPEGTVVLRVATWDNFWSRIEYNGGYYYVSSAYVKVVTPPPTETTTEEETTEEPTTMEPTTTPVASIDVIVPPDPTRPSTTQGQTSESVSGTEDISNPQTSLEGSLEDDTTIAPIVSNENHNGAKSGMISKIMTVCIVLMVVIFVVAVATELVPRKKKKRRRPVHIPDEY